MTLLHDHGAADVSTHPAARAWRQLHTGRAPAAIEAVKFPNWKKSTTAIYRLHGCASGPVIGKCCRAAKLAVERRVYLEVLGSLGMDLPCCYGYTADQDGVSGWLFLEQVSGTRYSEDDARHRSIASSWLGRMHLVTNGLALASILPPVTVERYRRLFDFSLEAFIRCCARHDLENDVRVAVTSAVRRLERLAPHWSTIAKLWAQAPRCLVHGDFIAKNALIDESGGEPRIRVLDWEASGWGCPAEDLAGLDIRVYRGHAGALWQDFGEERLQLLADIGSALRAVAFLKVYSGVVPERIVHVIDDIARYARQLEAAEERLGW
jgi:hypothetical protein